MLSYTHTQTQKHPHTHTHTHSFCFILPSYAACMYESTCTRSRGWGAHYCRKLRHDTRIHTISCVPTYTNFATHTIALLPGVASGFMGIQPIERGVRSPGMFVGQISLQDKLCSTPQVSPHVFLRKISPVSTNNPTTPTPSTDLLPHLVYPSALSLAG